MQAMVMLNLISNPSVAHIWMLLMNLLCKGSQLVIQVIIRGGLPVQPFVVSGSCHVAMLAQLTDGIIFMTAAQVPNRSVCICMTRSL
jgi:hypothetical protein